ncbi:MAG: hypothetical protein ABFE07_07335 [Armatimonadia bacterium]
MEINDATLGGIAAETCFAAQAAVLEEAEAQAARIEADQAYTDEHKQLRAHEIRQAALAKAQEAKQAWEQRAEALEAEATKQAQSREARTELYQLGYSNGMAMLNLMADNATPEALARELEEVVKRGVPGEVAAWTSALPLVMAKARHRASLLDDKAHGVEARCAEIAASLRTDRQLKAEEALAFLSKQRQRVGTISTLNSTSNFRQVRMRLQGQVWPA